MTVKFPYPTSKGTHHMEMKAHQKKMKLWKLAQSGAPKPKEMRDAFIRYMSPSLSTYDHDFAEALRKAAPTWFRRRARDTSDPFKSLFFAIYDGMEAGSYKEVASVAGVAETTVLGWVNGKDFTRNLLVLKRLSDASGISIDEMANMLFETRAQVAQ